MILPGLEELLSNDLELLGMMSYLQFVPLHPQYQLARDGHILLLGDVTHAMLLVEQQAFDHLLNVEEGGLPGRPM